MISMLIDHIGFILLENILLKGELLGITDKHAIAAFGATYMDLYVTNCILRMIGRIAFPIFCFLLVEGFLHTRSVKKYLGRLLLFALISELPFNLATFGTLFSWDYQNVYFTLLLGVLALAGIRMAEEKTEWRLPWRVLFGLLSVLLCAGSAGLLKTDYDIVGVLMIVVLYLLRPKKMLAMGLGCALLMELPAFIALLPIHFYNGQRGSNIKWIYYLFYPVHILLLYLLTCALGFEMIML